LLNLRFHVVEFPVTIGCARLFEALNQASLPRHTSRLKKARLASANLDSGRRFVSVTFPTRTLAHHLRWVIG
jgi:hypothetical protein